MSISIIVTLIQDNSDNHHHVFVFLDSYFLFSASNFRIFRFFLRIFLKVSCQIFVFSLSLIFELLFLIF